MRSGLGKRVLKGDSTIQLVRPLHFGPVSEVWLARRDGRNVVARRYLAPHSGTPWPDPPDPEILSALNHPRIRRFLGRTRDPDGETVYLFHYLEGDTLAARIQDGKPAPDLALDCLVDISQALGWMHDRSPVSPRIHADLSPGNVFRRTDGRFLLIDLMALQPGMFPVRPGVVFGTLPYLAPEVLDGAPPDTRSDVWGLATVVLRAARGDLPWASARTPAEARAMLDAARPASLAASIEGPRWFAELLIRMMGRAPDRRPTASEVFSIASGHRTPGPRRRPPAPRTSADE